MLDRVIQFELCTVQCGAVRDLRSFAFGIQSCRLNCIRYTSPHTCSKMLLSHTLSPGGGGSHEGRTTTSHHSRPHTEQCSHTRPRILTPRHIMWLRYPTCHARAHPPPTLPISPCAQTASAHEATQVRSACHAPPAPSLAHSCTPRLAALTSMCTGVRRVHIGHDTDRLTLRRSSSCRGGRPPPPRRAAPCPPPPRAQTAPRSRPSPSRPWWRSHPRRATSAGP